MDRQFTLKYLIVAFVIIAISLLVMRQDWGIGIYCLGIGCFLMQIVTIESYSIRVLTDMWSLCWSGLISLLIVSSTAAVISYVLTAFTDPGPNAVWMLVPPLMAIYCAITVPISLSLWLVPLGVAIWLLGCRGDGQATIRIRFWKGYNSEVR